MSIAEPAARRSRPRRHTSPATSSAAATKIAIATDTVTAVAANARVNDQRSRRMGWGVVTPWGTNPTTIVSSEPGTSLPLANVTVPPDAADPVAGAVAGAIFEESHRTFEPRGPT